MANIIWSFGIALTADDQASDRISGVLGLINQLDESLNRLNNQTVQTGQGFGSLGQASNVALAEATGGISLAVEGVLSFGSAAAGALMDLAKVGVDALLKVGRTTVPALFAGIKGALLGFDSMLHLTIDGASKFVDILQSVPDVISRWVFGKGLDDLRMSFEGAYNATRRFVDLGNEFYPMQRALEQLAIHSRNATVTTKGLSDHLIDVSFASGTSMQSLTELTTVLGFYGRNISELAGINPTASLDLNVMGKLVETFGLSAQGAVEVSNSLKYLGMSITDVTDQAAAFEQGFGIPGIMQMLPEVSKHAADAIGRFGRNVIGDETKVISNTLKTGATFSKAFGKDIAEATQMALRSFDKFSEAIETSQDVFLGLADDFSPLQTALFQYGMSFEQTQGLLRQGRDEPLKLAENFRKMAASMDPLLAQRFIRQITKELPEQGRLLRMSQKEFDAVTSEDREARAEAASAGEQAFEKLTTSMRNNAADMMKIFDNIKGAFRSTFGLLFAGDMTDVFADLVTSARGFATTLRSEFDKFASSEGFKTARAAIKSIATTLIGLGEASGMAAGVVSVVATFAGLLTPVASTLEVIKGAVSSLGPKGELSFGGLVKGAFKTIIGLETLSDTFQDIQKVVGGSGKGWEKFTGVGKAILLGFANYANKLFFGLPGKFVTEFVYGAEASKNTFGDALVTLFSKAKEKIREQLVEWRDAFLKSDFIGTLGKFGTDVGSALGNITKTVVDWVRGLFDEKQRTEMLQKLTSMFQTTAAEKDSITGALLDIGSHVFEGIKTMAVNFADAVLAPFGTNFDIVFDRMKVMLKGFAISAEESFDTVRSAVYTIQEYALPVFKILSTVIGASLQGVLALASGFVATTAIVSKAMLFLRSLLPEVAGGISQQVYNQSLKEVDDIEVGIKSKIGAISNTISDVNNSISAMNLDDLGAKREALEKRAKEREAGRVALAGEERKIDQKEAFFKNPREALMKELKVQLPGASTSMDQEFSTYSRLEAAINRAAYEKNEKRETALRDLMEEFRQASIRKQSGEMPVSTAGPDKTGALAPTRAAERVTPMAASSSKDTASSAAPPTKNAPLSGKVTVEIKHDDHTTTKEAFISNKP